MQKTVNRGYRDRIQKIVYFILFQMGFIVFLSFFLLFFSSNKVALSILLGGISQILPAILFTRISFRKKGAKFAKQIVSDLYYGEGLKWASSFVLFAGIFYYIPISPLAFFMGFWLMQLSNFILLSII